MIKKITNYNFSDTLEIIYKLLMTLILRSNGIFFYLLYINIDFIQKVLLIFFKK